MVKLTIVSVLFSIINLSGTTVITYTGRSCDSESYYKPHSIDCTLFYQCSPNGTYVLFTCPIDLHFNPILNVCDFPPDAGCMYDATTTNEPSSGESTTIDLGSGESTTINTSTSGESTTIDLGSGESTTIDFGSGESTTIDTGSGESTTVDIDESSTITTPSEDECNNGDYLVHETEEEAFYKCISGTFVVVYCPREMQFNITIKGCVPTPTVTTIVDTTTIVTTNSSLEPETSTLIISTDASTETTASTQECVNNECVPDESDCEAFYRCINGRFTKLFCPIGRHYDPITQTCYEPELDGCGTPETTTNDDTSTEASRELLSIESSDECVNNEYQQHESYCEAFYRCVNGIFLKLFCPSGRHYNPNSQKCEEPNEDGCCFKFF